MLCLPPCPGRTSSTASELESPVEPHKALDLLLSELTLYYRTLAMFGTDPELITQVFRQVRCGMQRITFLLTYLTLSSPKGL